MKSKKELSNAIYHADCISVLSREDGLGKIPAESIDLVYLDPPFFSGKNYDIVWGNGAEIESYTRRPVDTNASIAFADDTMYWAEQTPDSVGIAVFVDELIRQGLIDKSNRDEAILKRASAMRGRVGRGAIHGYLAYMAPRLRAIHRVLKPTGSIYLHCDYHANAHLRILMDEIFGECNFQNEIIWNYRQYAQSSVRGSRFERTFDSILVYSKTKDYVFNPVYGEIQIPIAEASKHGFMNDEGGWFKTAPTGLGTGGYSQETVDRMDKEGLIHWTRGGNPRKKYYRDSDDDFIFDKKMIGAVWTDILDMMHVAKDERLGYPTQKPEALIERIVMASSNEGDIVLDPFMGGGTTLAVAHRLGRKWIGIDVSPRACDATRGRLKKLGAKVPRRIPVPFDPSVEAKLEMTMAMLRAQDWSATEEWVRQQLGFAKTRTSERYGIDGIKGKTFLEVKDWSGPVGKPVVEKLAGEMLRRGSTEGVIASYEFSAGALKAMKDFAKKGLNIEAVYFSDIASKTIQLKIDEVT